MWSPRWTQPLVPERTPQSALLTLQLLRDWVDEESERLGEHNMLRLFNKPGPKTPPPAPPALDLTKVNAVIQSFPIGAGLRYYPEFKQNIVLESLVLGYLLNQTLVFSAQEVACEGSGKSLELFVGPQRKAMRLTSFGIVVPSASRGIDQLDYARREELQRTGGLAKGNNITLMAQSREGKTPVVQTTVRKPTIVKEGLYANTPVVVLDVDCSSLLLTDQRAHMRLKTHLAAHVQFGNDAIQHCTLVDFSERSVRLRADEWPINTRTGRAVTLTFALSNRAGNIVLRGPLFRKDDNDLVVMLEEIQRGEEFLRIELIDVLGIKAALLQLPQTSV